MVGGNGRSTDSVVSRHMHSSPWEILEGPRPTLERIQALSQLEGETRCFRDRAERDRLERLLDHVPEDLEQAVLRTLVRIHRTDYRQSVAAGTWPDSSQKVALARQMLEDQDPASRLQLVEASLQNEAFETFPVLLERFETEPDPVVRGALAKALGVLGSRKIVPVLKKASRSRSPETRKGALEGLTFQYGKERTRLILERLLDPEVEIRDEALRCLGLMPLGEILEVLESIPPGRGGKLRRASVRYLALHPEDLRCREMLQGYMHSSTPLVSAEALLALARLGDDAALGRIVDLDGKCDRKMQKVLDLAKRAYDDAMEADYSTVSELLDAVHSSSTSDTLSGDHISHASRVPHLPEEAAPQLPEEVPAPHPPEPGPTGPAPETMTSAGGAIFVPGEGEWTPGTGPLSAPQAAPGGDSQQGAEAPRPELTAVEMVLRPPSAPSIPLAPPEAPLPEETELASRETFIGPAPTGPDGGGAATPGGNPSLSILDTVVGSSSPRPTGDAPDPLASLSGPGDLAGENPWDSVIRVREDPGSGGGGAGPSGGVGPGAAGEQDEDLDSGVEPVFDIPVPEETGGEFPPGEAEPEEPHFEIPLATGPDESTEPEEPHFEIPAGLVPASPGGAGPEDPEAAPELDLASRETAPLFPEVEEVGPPPETTPGGPPGDAIAAVLGGREAAGEGEAGAAKPRRASNFTFRLLLLLMLVYGVVFTGTFAYQAGVAASVVDQNRQKLRTDFNRLTRAIHAYRTRTGRRFLDPSLRALVPDPLPELPFDPWTQRYLFDPVLGQLISPGPDGKPSEAARLDEEKADSDDRRRFVDPVPPPLAVSIREGATPRLVVLRPGTDQVLPVEVPDEEVAPLRPVLDRGQGRLAYLRFSPQEGIYRAWWRRREAGTRFRWTAPVPVLPERWEVSEICWMPSQLVVLALATPPGKRLSGLYRISLVEDGEPTALVEGLVEPRSLAIAPDGTRVVLSTQNSPQAPRRLRLLDVPTWEDWGKVQPRRVDGPRGDHARFDPAEPFLYYIGEDPRHAGRQGVFRWGYRLQEGGFSVEQASPAGELLHSSSQALGETTLSPRGDLLALVEGKRVLVLNLGNREVRPILESPHPILGLSWPFPAPEALPEE